MFSPKKNNKIKYKIIGGSEINLALIQAVI